MSAGPTNGQILVHQVGNSVTWEILLNITVVLALFKHSWSAAFLHMAIGIIMLFLTYFFVLWFLAPFGFIQSQEAVLVYYLHAIIGCAMLGFVVIIAASGLFTRYAKDLAFSRGLKNFIKRFHKIFAYLVIILFKINILFNWYTTTMPVFTFLTAWDVFFFLLWAYLKFFKEKLEDVVTDMRVRKSKKSIQEIGSMMQLQEMKDPYVIYNGYVYDASRLTVHHPGGQKVISSILGREVDRFLYGMYSSELVPEVPPRSHSTGALVLLREPIYKVTIPPTFKGFDDGPVAVSVQFMNEISKQSKIYFVGLAAARGELEFTGYSDVRQLGQYYSLTMGESITRLYTAVNFLSRHNIRLMNQLMPTLKYDIQDGKTFRSKRSNLTELRDMRSNKETKMIDDEDIHAKKYLPIMLKIYDQGKFTSRLLKMDLAKARLQLSPPKGFGLQLDVTKAGRIVIVAGGTGLFPFCDIIDLLYKSLYLEETSNHKNEILQANPILKSDPFNKYSFVLLAAINDPQDIHPITQQQLVFLSRRPSKFKVVLRVSKNEQSLKSLDSKIQFTRDYFTNRVIAESSSDDFSRVWICGPPKMCTEVANSLLGSGYGRSSFLLL